MPMPPVKTEVRAETIEQQRLTAAARGRIKVVLPGGSRVRMAGTTNRSLVPHRFPRTPIASCTGGKLKES